MKVLSVVSEQSLIPMPQPVRSPQRHEALVYPQETFLGPWPAQTLESGLSIHSKQKVGQSWSKLVALDHRAKLVTNGQVTNYEYPK